MLGSTQGELSQSVAATPVRPEQQVLHQLLAVESQGDRLAHLDIFQRRVALFGVHG